MNKYAVNDVLDRVWNDSGYESAEESDKDYTDEYESKQHDVSSASEEEPNKDGPDGNSSADDAQKKTLLHHEREIREQFVNGWHRPPQDIHWLTWNSSEH